MPRPSAPINSLGFRVVVVAAAEGGVVELDSCARRRINSRIAVASDGQDVQPDVLCVSNACCLPACLKADR